MTGYAYFTARPGADERVIGTIDLGRVKGRLAVENGVTIWRCSIPSGHGRFGAATDPFVGMLALWHAIGELAATP